MHDFVPEHGMGPPRHLEIDFTSPWLGDQRAADADQLLLLRLAAKEVRGDGLVGRNARQPPRSLHVEVAIFEESTRVVWLRLARHVDDAVLPLLRLAEALDDVVLADPVAEVVTVPVRGQDDPQRACGGENSPPLRPCAAPNVEHAGVRIPKRVEQQRERDHRDCDGRAVRQVARRQAYQVVVDGAGEVACKRAEDIDARCRIERPEPEQRRANRDGRGQPGAEPSTLRQGAYPDPDGGRERTAHRGSEDHERQAFAGRALAHSKRVERQD